MGQKESQSLEYLMMRNGSQESGLGKHNEISQILLRQLNKSTVLILTNRISGYKILDRLFLFHPSFQVLLRL